MFAGMRSKGTLAPLRIDDETAVAVMDAINALREARGELYHELVINYHVRRYTLERLARETSADRRKTTERLREAESWIDGRLFEKIWRKSA
jgi:hypothetical protein